MTPEQIEIRELKEIRNKLLTWLEEACIVLDGLLSRSSGQTLAHPWSDACRKRFDLERPDYEASKESEVRNENQG